jgi:hypothetical protein
MSGIPSSCKSGGWFRSFETSQQRFRREEGTANPTVDVSKSLSPRHWVIGPAYDGELQEWHVELACPFRCQSLARRFAMSHA